MKNKTRKAKSKNRGKITLQKLHIDRDQHDVATALGGLSLSCLLARKVDFIDSINNHVNVFKIHQGYSEGDHFLHLVNSIFAGASCIEDGSRLRSDQSYSRLLNIDKVVAPSTTGDFLRRFNRSDINNLKEAIWEIRKKVWKKGKRKMPKRATLDLDSKIQDVCGECKEGADFSWKGGFAYHPELLSFAETGEWLDAVNRSGNEQSGDKAAYLLRRNLPKLRDNFESVCVRGDSKYGRTDVLEECNRNNTNVCLCWPHYPNIASITESLSDEDWVELKRHADRSSVPSSQQRKKRKKLRRRKARERGYKDKLLLKEDVAEFAYRPTRNKKKMNKTYRMIVIRKQIEVAGKNALFNQFEYRYILTDLSGSCDQIVDYAYGRSNQENLIEQAKNGVSAFRMPTGQLLANEVWMLAALLAHNFKNWLCLLSLGTDKLSWEWKRFRYLFVYVVARIIRGGRQIRVLFSSDEDQYRQLSNGLKALGAGGT